MTLSELQALYFYARGFEEELVRAVFGERAGRYKWLERKSESPYDIEGAEAAYREMEAMQGELSEEQRQRLFGIDLDVYLPEPDEILDYIRAMHALDYSSEPRLGDSLKYGFIRVGDKSSPEEMRDDQRRGYAQVRAAALHAEFWGWDSRKVLRAAWRGVTRLYDDRGDAELVGRRILRLLEEVEGGAGWFYVWTRESREIALAA
jgi:hypothetical protein